MAADTIPDEFQMAGAPPGGTDTVSTSPIGPAYVAGTVVHTRIAGGTPAPDTPTP